MSKIGTNGQSLSLKWSRRCHSIHQNYISEIVVVNSFAKLILVSVEDIEEEETMRVLENCSRPELIPIKDLAVEAVDERPHQLLVEDKLRFRE